MRCKETPSLGPPFFPGMPLKPACAIPEAPGVAATITILGGGPAGLAVAHAARHRQLPTTLFEAGARLGGTCITYRRGDFSFDSGAHRLHDKDPETTALFKRLLGGDLRRVDIGSVIWDEGRLLPFPLDAIGLLRHLGPSAFTAAGLDLLRARLRGTDGEDFESRAVGRYGRRIASRFLLNYSHKLWGLPTDQLSPTVAGNRLNGLDLRAFLADTVLGGRRQALHLEGAFFYPRLGIGQITDALVEACDPASLHTNSAVTRVLHDGSSVRAVEINGSDVFDVHAVVSTLPLPLLLRLLDPAPPSEIIDVSKALRYRHVRLVAMFLDRPSVTEAATVYFPDRRFPFTRIYEPRVRSADMAPQGATSLVAELPCQEEDKAWTDNDSAVIELVCRQLEDIAWLRKGELLDACTRRLVNAYPVLDTGSAARVQAVCRYLGRFGNLHLSGRSGRFVYGWIHTMMRFGRDVVETLTDED